MSKPGIQRLVEEEVDLMGEAGPIVKIMSTVTNEWNGNPG